MTDRLDTAWKLAVFVACLAALVVWGRLSARRSAPRDTPAPPQPQPEDDAPVCRSRGCTAPATRGIPEARPWRPLPWLLPRWEIVTDAEADPALCAAHHGPLVAALTARAAQERAALEEHLAARHRELVAWALSQLTRDHGIAPPPPRPSPLRGATLPPVATEAPPAVDAGTPQGRLLPSRSPAPSFPPPGVRRLRREAATPPSPSVSPSTEAPHSL